MEFLVARFAHVFVKFHVFYQFLLRGEAEMTGIAGVASRRGLNFDDRPSSSAGIATGSSFSLSPLFALLLVQNRSTRGHHHVLGSALDLHGVAQWVHRFSLKHNVFGKWSCGVRALTRLLTIGLSRFWC